MAVMQGLSRKKNHIRGNAAPPKGAEATGEVVNGKPVYRMRERVKIGVKPMTSVAGQPIYKSTQPGLPPQQRLSPVFETRTYEFVLEDVGSGMVKKNRHFRESPEVLAAQAAKKRREDALERWQEALVSLDERGIDPAQLVRAIENETTTPAPTPANGAAADRMAKARAAKAAKRQAQQNGG